MAALTILSVVVVDLAVALVPTPLQLHTGRAVLLSDVARKTAQEATQAMGQVIAESDVVPIPWVNPDVGAVAYAPTTGAEPGAAT